MLSLIWRPEARQDMRDIIGYIAARRPAAAQKLGEAILHTAERLPEQSYLYRNGRFPGTREAVVHPNYLIVYRVAADAIEILALIHARQHYP